MLPRATTSFWMYFVACFLALLLVHLLGGAADTRDLFGLAFLLLGGAAILLWNRAVNRHGSKANCAQRRELLLGLVGTLILSCVIVYRAAAAAPFIPLNRDCGFYLESTDFNGRWISLGNGFFWFLFVVIGVVLSLLSLMLTVIHALLSRENAKDDNQE